MIDGQRVLAVILARGGSKGLPGKNIMDLGGRPVVAWSVAACQGSRYVDRCILSTDDEAIAQAGRAAGCDVPFLRPAEFATDDAPLQGALIHALDSVGEAVDILVALQATSPLRQSGDIDGCLETLVGAAGESCATVTESGKSPYWHVFVDADKRLRTVIPEPGSLYKRRQELPRTFELNGAVFAVRIDWFRRGRVFYDDRTLAHVMARENSVDIDTALDLAVARGIVEMRRS